jgi:riboflavin biosynthesis pyrimidine reductase
VLYFRYFKQSNTLEKLVPESQLYSGDLITLITQLHAEEIEHIWIDGGVTISHFLRLNLVDDMILSIIPILVGEDVAFLI